MKWAIRGLLVVVALVIVVLVGVYFYLDRIAKTTIERGGTYATGVDVSVDGVTLGVFSGEAGLDQLTIANPVNMGFESDHFLKLGKADAAVSVGSLFADEVVVPRIHLDGISLNLEHKEGKDNYAVILENLQKLSSGEKPQATEEAPAQKWIVNDLRVTNIDVTASVKGLVSDNQTVNVKIPEIALQNVQSDSLAELQGQVLKQVLSEVMRQAGAQLPGLIANELGAGVGKIGELGQATLGKVSESLGNVSPEAAKAVGELGKGVGEATGKAGEEAGKALEKVGEGLGGILGGKKDEEKPKEGE